MIQDIAPHRMDNQYRTGMAPEKESPVLVFTGSRMENIMFLMEDGQISFPTREQMPEGLTYTYLFSIDEAGGRYYIDVPEDEADAAAVETGTAAGAATAAEADAAAGKTGTSCSKCGTAAGLAALFSQNAECVEDVAVRFVTENKVHVTIPEEVPASVLKAPFWDAYNTRCIACGRCNFVCPTCTCYTMQDVFYSDNGKVGERRRVGSSCMVDGYTDVAGGGQYRRGHGERMRFKVLHKIYDFRKRFGYDMCVGCGRCDDVCPEYISYSNIINRVNEACTAEEVEKG